MDKYLIKKSEIEEFNGEDKTHFLNKNAVRKNKSLGDLTGLQNIGFHIVEVQPGFALSEKHKHYFEEECLYVLEGKAEAEIGDKKFEVNAGDFIGFRANGEAHSLKNTGDRLLRCIVVGQRLDHDIADYPNVEKRLYRNKGMKWNLIDLTSLIED